MWCVKIDGGVQYDGGEEDAYRFMGWEWPLAGATLLRRYKPPAKRPKPAEPPGEWSPLCVAASLCLIHYSPSAVAWWLPDVRPELAMFCALYFDSGNGKGWHNGVVTGETRW